MSQAWDQPSSQASTSVVPNPDLPLFLPTLDDFAAQPPQKVKPVPPPKPKKTQSVVSPRPQNNLTNTTPSPVPARTPHDDLPPLPPRTEQLYSVHPVVDESAQHKSNNEALLPRSMSSLARTSTPDNKPPPPLVEAKTSILDSFGAETLDNKYPIDKVELDWNMFPEKRHKIAYELLTTEQTYVRTLQLLVHFYQPAFEELFEEEDISVASVIRTAFKHVSDILNINQLLLNNLTERFKNWSQEQQIGDVIATITPFLRIYQSYISVYDEAMNGIKDAEQKFKVFSTFLETLQAHPLSKAQLLSGFLIQPVQRVPRYVLLISDLIANTPETHPDHKQLIKALSVVKEVAISINEAVHAAENQAKCREIQAMFGGSINIVEAHRKFIKEGTLIKQCRKERKMRRIFLFTDIIIYGFDVPGLTHIKLSQKLNLESTVAESVPDNPSLSLENTILIQAPGKSFYLFAKSPEEKIEWMSALNKAIEEEAKRIQTIKGKEQTVLEAAPVWAPDSLADECPFCKEKFTFYFRRHHCRLCGSVACGNCTTHKLLIPHINKKSKERVCDVCYENSNK